MNKSDDSHIVPNKERPPNTPKWVKVTGIILIILILLFIALKVAGIGGNHGPGRHLTVAPYDGQILQESFIRENPQEHEPIRGNIS